MTVQCYCASTSSSKYVLHNDDTMTGRRTPSVACLAIQEFGSDEFQLVYFSLQSGEDANIVGLLKSKQEKNLPVGINYTGNIATRINRSRSNRKRLVTIGRGKYSEIMSFTLIPYPTHPVNNHCLHLITVNPVLINYTSCPTVLLQ